MTTLSSKAKNALDERIASINFYSSNCFCSDFRDLQKNAIKDKKLPSFILGITNIEEEIYFNGGGQSNIDDPESGEVNPDSVFWICSQTKMISAVSSFPTEIDDLLTLNI